MYTRWQKKFKEVFVCAMFVCMGVCVSVSMNVCVCVCECVCVCVRESMGV